MEQENLRTLRFLVKPRIPPAQRRFRGTALALRHVDGTGGSVVVEALNQANLPPNFGFIVILNRRRPMIVQSLGIVRKIEKTVAAVDRSTMNRDFPPLASNP